MVRARDRVGDSVAALRERNDLSPEAVERVRDALGSNEPRLVATAARLTGASGYTVLTSALITAFERLVDGGHTADPRCHAKEALVAALVELGHDDPDVFVRGLSVTQFDPAFGVPPPGEETAGAVRSICALHLAQTTITTEALLGAVAPAMFDPSAHVRQDAVRAVGACSGWEAHLLLEVKLAADDPEPAVVGECLLELLNADAARYLSHARRLIAGTDPLRRLQAVCAMSECRDALAADALVASCGETQDPEDLEERFFALGRCRHDVAAAFLDDRIANGSLTEQHLARRARH